MVPTNHVTYLQTIKKKRMKVELWCKNHKKLLYVTGKKAHLRTTINYTLIGEEVRPVTLSIAQLRLSEGVS